jgi:NAD(P)-dependent dehydrogenase (short-subunit alcohol dehydrogenase family)
VSEKKVWLITGAGRGLGVDIAKAALTAGHAVVATGAMLQRSRPQWATTTTCWPSSST